ncbi:MAG: hypothetical protein ACXVLQ_07785 [Bacteriovorax sp.]
MKKLSLGFIVIFIASLSIKLLTQDQANKNANYQNLNQKIDRDVETKNNDLNGENINRQILRPSTNPNQFENSEIPFENFQNDFRENFVLSDEFQHNFSTSDLETKKNYKEALEAEIKNDEDVLKHLANANDEESFTLFRERLESKKKVLENLQFDLLNE